MVDSKQLPDPENQAGAAFSGNDELIQRRRRDFFTSLALLLLAFAMLAKSLTFPMTDSYGGVTNAWYVSPALFPLSIAVTLGLVSLLLLRRAILDGGARRRESASKSRSKAFFPASASCRVAVIMAFIGLYVYSFVPSVDFALASALFLFLFITPFYIEKVALIPLTLIGAVIACVLITLLSHRPTSQQYTLDLVAIATLLTVATIAWWLLRRTPSECRKLRTVVLVSIAVPLVLVPIFRFFLLVPLPVEGLVIDTMQALVSHLTAQG